MPNTKPLASQSRYPGPGSLATRTVDDKLREIVSVKDFGAVGDGSTDDTNAIKLAIAEAFVNKRTIFFPQGSYVVSDELRLDGGSGSFVGVAVEGENVDATKILFKPASATAKCFSLNGGSGTHTNKYIKRLTIQPFNSSYNGLGSGIFFDGQCFALVSEVVVVSLNYGIQITNTHAGSFSEFNVFEKVRLVENIKNIAFECNGGNDSFHGNRFHDVQINIPENGYGIYSKGISGVNYIYNCYFRINLFGGSGTRYGIYTENTNTDFCSGWLSGEGAMTLKATATGEWHMNGLLNSISPITLDAPNEGAFLFANRTNGASFAASGMTLYSPDVLTASPVDRANNGYQPALFKIVGANIDSIGFACYQYAGNGFYFGRIPFQGKFSQFAPGLKIEGDGSALQSYNTSVQMRDSAATANQLLLSNGRTGGNIGRSLSYAVTANAGVAQAITTLGNGNSAHGSLVVVRIFGSNFEHRYLVTFNHQGYGGSGFVTTVATYWQLNTAGVTFNSFSVNSSGQLVVNVTTNQNLTIQCQELGLGYQQTA